MVMELSFLANVSLSLLDVCESEISWELYDGGIGLSQSDMEPDPVLITQSLSVRPART